MSEIAERTLRETTPPRWIGTQSLGPVQQFNERCFELLRGVAASGNSDATLALLVELRPLWTGLGAAATQRLARMPFVVVDARFSDEPRWRQAIDSREHAVGTTQNGLPSEINEQLMHEVMMFAWQTARWDATVAGLSFGMTRTVVPLIAGLTPHQIRTIASRESQTVQIRWADNLVFWEDLLRAAVTGNDAKLAALQLEAKLMLVSELCR